MKPHLAPVEHPEWAQREAEEWLARNRADRRRAQLFRPAIWLAYLVALPVGAFILAALFLA